METIEKNADDSTAYFENRLDINNLKNINVNPYPNSYNITKTFDEYIKAYSYIESGTQMEE